MGGGSLYAYGVIEQEDVAFETDGVGGATEVYTVDHRTLSAVVSDVDTVEPERTDENARNHDDVLQELLQYDGGRTVVPMQFGMAFASAGTLKNVLRGTRPALTRALREVEGTVELGLKVVSEAGAEGADDGIERVGAETSGAAGASDDARDGAAGSAGDVDAATIEAAVSDRFDDLAQSVSTEDRFSDRLLVNRSYLVDRDDREAFDRAVEEFEEEFDDVTVRYTGPWAPYNFVDVDVGARR